MAPPTTGKDTSFSDLGDDAVGEVLTCLPSQTSLAVASAVCKPWLKICKSPVFLRHFRRCHPGADPLLGLLHFSGNMISNLRMIWDAGASSRPDLTVTLRSMEKTVGDLARFCCNLDLQVVDHYGSWCLLKPRTSNNMLFVFDLLTGQNKELRGPEGPEEETFFLNMTGFIIEGGNIIFVRKRTRSYYYPSRAPNNDCYFYTASNGQWRNVEPTCREADAADYARRRHNILWKKCVRDVVYSLCGDFTISWWLTALDTRSMSYYIVKPLRCMQRYRKLPGMTIMEMDKPGRLCPVLVAGEPLNVWAWIWQQGEGNASTAAGEGEWKLYRKVDLQGLASMLAVQLQRVHVVAAYAGVVHLSLLAAAKEHEQDMSYYFASLDLVSSEFTNVQAQENFGCPNKIYPFFLPWCGPFLPPADDNAEACD